MASAAGTGRSTDPTDLTWFRRPAPDGSDPGSLNPVFQLLDRAVIGGRSDEPVLLGGPRPLSHATLLEEVAGVGGVLRALGVEPGTPVACLLPGDRRGITALLALARLGAVLDDTADLAITESGVGEVAWELVRSAGRTDPAPAAELSPDAPWTGRRTAADLARILRQTKTPVDPVDLAHALRG